jgi:hypothetical protein
VAEPVSINGATGKNAPVQTLSHPMVRISSDGRYVAFCSPQSLDPDHPVADGLVACYRRDRAAEVTELISYAKEGTVPQSSAGALTMTPDGRYLGYVLSSASEVLRYDTLTHEVRYIGPTNIAAYTLTPSGDFVPYGAVSSDGRYALSAARPVRIDLRTGDQVSYATSADGTPDGASDVAADGAAISGDGRYVAFWSTDYALVPGTASPCSYSCGRIFRKDLVTGGISVVDVAGDSAGSDAVGGPDMDVSISDDGAKVAFNSIETLDGAHVRHSPGDFYGYVRDLDRGESHLVAGSEYAAADPAGVPELSGDGTTVAWITDVGDFVTRSDNQSARHATTALAADPASQSARVGLDGGAPVVLRASYDDGTTQTVPAFAWRIDIGGTNTAGARADGDRYLFTDTNAETVHPTVATWDDSGRSVTFTIVFERPTLIVTPHDQTIIYGDPEPTYSFAVSGLASTDTLAQQPTCMVAGPHTDPGVYPIVCQGARANGYDITYRTGTLTVTRAPTALTVSHLTGTTISAALTYGSHAKPAVNETISFRVRNTSLCTARTNAAGRASCSLPTQKWLIVVLALGHYQAGFAGSIDLQPASGSV